MCTKMVKRQKALEYREIFSEKKEEIFSAAGFGQRREGKAAGDSKGPHAPGEMRDMNAHTGWQGRSELRHQKGSSQDSTKDNSKPGRSQHRWLEAEARAAVVLDLGA